MTQRIEVSAVVLRDPQPRILLVRKRGTTMWMNPGGKPEPGESGAECAAREVGEELGLRIDPARLVFLGRFSAPAANEPGHTVAAQCYLWPDPVDPGTAPAAEIEEIRWVTAADLDDPSLAPLFVVAIAPILLRDLLW